MARRKFWSWLRGEWSTHRWHMLEAIGALGTALGAIWIPIIIDHTADERHATEVETRTLQMVNEVSREIAEIIERNPALGRHDGKYVVENFTYQAIIKDDKTNAAAIRLLNEYEFVCLGGNKRLFKSDIIKDLRGGATALTWTLYKDYIVESRKEANIPQLWQECELWLNKNKIAGWKEW